MASIIKRKSKYSVVYYFTDEKGGKHQKWETCQDYADAKRRKAEIENQQINGTFIPPQELTVKDFLQDFVRIYGKANPKSETLTPGVINSIHKLLRCAFEQAVKWEIIARNPFPMRTNRKISIRQSRPNPVSGKQKNRKH